MDVVGPPVAPPHVRTPEDLTMDPKEDRFITEQVIGSSKGKRPLRGMIAHTLENSKSARMDNQVGRFCSIPVPSMA